MKLFRFRQPDNVLLPELVALRERVALLEETVERASLKWGELADITRRAQARWEQRERRDASPPPGSGKAEARRILSQRRLNHGLR